MSGDVQLSKYMSYLLRHAPEAAELTMDRRGWVALEELTEACVAAGRARLVEDVLRTVAESDKQRFKISTDGTAIRAAQGHSIGVDLGLEPVTPPPTLFHGTVARFMDNILAEGLRPMARAHVHLSPDIETALRVGQRRGRAVVLEVDAAAMQAAGCEFFESSNGVWLVDRVAPEYLRLRD